LTLDTLRRSGRFALHAAGWATGRALARIMPAPQAAHLRLRAAATADSKLLMLARGDLALWLSGPGTSASRPLANGSVPVPGGWNRLVIEVPDIQAAMQGLLLAGAKFRSEPVQGPGGKQVLVEDPSGNPIELFQASGK